MDRRTLFALLLTAIVIVVTPMLFPAPKQPRRPTSDTTRMPRDSVATTAIDDKAPPPRASMTKPASPMARTASAETTMVRTNRAVYYLVSPGGTPANVSLPEYSSLRPDARRATPVSLVDSGDRLL